MSRLIDRAAQRFYARLARESGKPFTQQVREAIRDGQPVPVVQGASRQFFTELLAASTASGTAVNTTTTETILIPNVTIPANYLQDGRALLVEAFGVYGTTSTPTLNIRLRAGGVGGTILGGTGAFTTTSGVGGGASMTANWCAKAYVQTRTNGSSGTLWTSGRAEFFTSTLGTAGTVTNYGMGQAIISGSTTPTPGTAATTSTVDLTADQALSFTGTWGTSNAANNIQVVQYYIWGLN